MKHIRKKTLAIALVVLLITLLANTTLAYYTIIGRATNVVTSGDITLAIYETTDGGKPFPKDKVTVIPGEDVQKKVTIRNICTHPFWLRVKLVYGTDSRTLDPKEVLLITGQNGEEWTERDGYFYYRKVLLPGEETVPLFEAVHIAGDKVDQHNAAEMLSLTVKAYAVQSENNSGLNPWDVAGWPVD